MTACRLLIVCAAATWIVAGCATTPDLALLNRTEAENFFAKNRHAAGVFETASALQYKVITYGEGPSPRPRDTVLVKYRGYFIGQETPFDVPQDESAPSRVPLSGVIAGWREGILLMRPGARFVLYIPPHLAFGKKGAPPQVGPYQALIYDIELVGIDAPRSMEQP